LDDAGKDSLLGQIAELDFDQLDKDIEKYVKCENPLQLPTEFDPAPMFPAVADTDELKEKYARAKQLGSDLISKGKVAAFVVAGGQGTRLGFDGPKGCYPTSPVKNKMLFQLFAENIAAAQQKYNAQLSWYIMASELNYDATIACFEQNDYFGLNKENVFMFIQGTGPNFSTDGKILLADKDTIACSPDGHGGSLKALYKSGAISDMKKKDIEYISYFQVDNPLINIFDPLFIGLHAGAKAGMSSKALIKAEPKEKVGNFCLVNDRVTVIEYSDLPDEQAIRRNPDGTLVFTLGSIAIHILSVDFVAQLNSKGFALPYHRAVKKISCLASDGNKITLAEPNGIKLETFVFDALPLSEKSIIFETLRDQEFAPVKNATGVDSAEVTRKMMTARAADWLAQGGVEIPQKPDGTADCIIEMAASFALHKEDVPAKADKIKPIKAGDEVCLD